MRKTLGLVGALLIGTIGCEGESKPIGQPTIQNGYKIVCEDVTQYSVPEKRIIPVIDGELHLCRHEAGFQPFYTLQRKLSQGNEWEWVVEFRVSH